MLVSPEKTFSDLIVTIGEPDNWNMSETLRQEIELDEMTFFFCYLHQVLKKWKRMDFENRDKQF